MALAYISFEESDGENRRFKLDLGRNRFYAYAIGRGEQIKRNGVPLLRDASYESELFGPLEEADGRGELLVPERLFAREYRFIQLQTFRTHDGIGPAVSPIVELEPGYREYRDQEGDVMDRHLAMSAVTCAPRPAIALASVPRPRRRGSTIS